MLYDTCMQSVSQIQQVYPGLIPPVRAPTFLFRLPRPCWPAICRRRPSVLAPWSTNASLPAGQDDNGTICQYNLTSSTCYNMLSTSKTFVLLCFFHLCLEFKDRWPMGMCPGPFDPDAGHEHPTRWPYFGLSGQWLETKGTGGFGDVPSNS